MVSRVFVHRCVKGLKGFRIDNIPDGAGEVEVDGVLGVGGAGGVHHGRERVETAQATTSSCSYTDE